MPKAGLLWSLFLYKKIMSWRVIYIESSDYLSLYLDNLRIKKGIDETIIPLSDLNSIVIDNNNIVLSTALINKCMEYKVNIILCDIYHLPNALIIPYSGNYQSTAQLKKQIDWTDDIKNIIWKIIIEKKILNQSMILLKHRRDKKVIDHMTKFSDEVKPGDKTNREGLAAKIYFRELFGKDFIRHADDIVNAGLNYGYSILRSQISRALVARGLNPHLGIFHKGRSNQFNLADDVIEVFRPIIDDYVFINLLESDSFIRDHRLALIELTTEKIKIDGNYQTIVNAMNIMIDSILNAIETGNIDLIKLPEPLVNE